DAAFCALQKMDQKQTLSERSEFRLFPIFCNAQNVMALRDITRRASLRSPFFCFLFFGEAKKRKWLSGHPRLVSTKRNPIISQHN
ncbi:MAG: hypothetical protein V4488_21760, partial [Pseudomonadota bacterium]